MDLIVREFAKEDQKAARELILSGLGEHFGFVDYSMNPDIDDIWNNYVLKGNKFIVAEKAGSIVGTAALIEENCFAGRIARMSVDTSIRRQGIGKKLLEALKSEAARKGYSKLILSTEVGWDAAIGLYSSCGFCETGRNEVDVHMELDFAW